MIKSIARYTVLAGIFIIPFIPFLVTESMFFPFITGKNFAFRIIVDIILAAWALLAVLDPAYRPKRSGVAWAMLAFLVVIGIADALGINPSRSFWSNYERMEGFIAMLHLGAYFLVAGSVLITEKLWNRLFNTTVIASVAMSLYAFMQLAGWAEIHQGGIRVDATLGNATYLAVYLLIHVFLALLLAYRNRHDRKLIGFYGTAIVLQLVALFYTGTRGAILGVIGGVLLTALIMLIFGKAHPRIRKLSGITLVVVAIAAGAFFAVRNTAFVQESVTLSRIANISLQDTTTQSRFILWTKIGWNAFKERPLLGWGQDNFIVVFGKYYDPEMYKQEPWFDRAHNVFVDWLIAGGALGLLAYLLLFASGLWALWRGAFSLPERALLTGLLAAYAFHNIFVFDNLISYIFFVTLLAYLHYARYAGTQAAPAAPRRSTEEREGLPIVAGGAVALAVGLIYFLNMPYLVRAQTLIDTIMLDYGKRYDAVESAYAQTLARGGLGLSEAREQLVQSAIRIWGSDAPEEVRVSLAARARAEMERSVADDPTNTRPIFFLGYLLTRVGPLEEGIATLERALAINPSRQNFLYEIATAYLRTKQFDKATLTFKEALDTAPDNDTARAYYAASLMFSGRFAEGQRELMDHFGTTTVDNPILLDAYVAVNRYDLVRQTLERRLADMAPKDDAQTRYSLGIVLLQLGLRDSALEQFERAIELDDDFAAEGNTIIDAIRSGKGIKIN